jgi:AAA domain, putative AbiEii toxin, Type IV TA system/AAA ATPase domain
MKLKSFQIKNYKVIDDTGSVKLDPKLTALVGKNESGKTAIMKALWKSRNIAGAKYDKLYDFPRDRYPKERSGNQVVAVLEFGLSDQETATLAELLPARLGQRPTKITRITRYEGPSAVGSEIIFEPWVAESITGREAAHAIEALAKAAASQATVESDPVQRAASAAIQQIDAAMPLWSERNVKALESVSAAVTNWAGAGETKQGEVSAERTALENLLGKARQGDPTTRARAWAEENLPTFIYYDDYGSLETLIHLPSFLARQDKPDAKARTQAALFEWTGLDPREILSLGRPASEGETAPQVQRRLEERRALLKAASFSLTGEWVELWTGDEHRLELDIDGDYLVLQVSDRHSPYPIPFEERSKGFQWFLSFYLTFLVESRKAHKDAILLLDEPGLHLHPSLQARLVNFLDRISETNQILYSTHLPFLIDASHFERVRTVHLSGAPPQKAVVSDDLRTPVDRDTLFPLQAALGHSLAQSLFLARWTLIVEGLTDFWLLRALHSCLATLKDDDALHRGIAILPAGGIALIAPLGSIILASIGRAEGKMLVLLNSDNEGREAARRLEKVFGDEAPVVTVGGSLGMEEATVDDLVVREAYATAVQQTCERAFTLNPAELAAPTNIRALDMLYRRNNWGTFGATDRAPAALWLAGQWADAGSVPNVTLERARSLFRNINRHFSPDAQPDKRRPERSVRDRLLAVAS